MVGAMERLLTGTEKRSKQKVQNARKEHKCEHKEQPKQSAGRTKLGESEEVKL
jgi:hypothetical protein